MSITPSDPRHGTRAGYTAGCRDTCCARENYRYQKAARLRLLREGPQMVDATPMLERIAWWADHGVSGNAVQCAAGIGVGTLRELVSGGRGVCLRSTARAVLGVRWDDLPDNGLCSAALTRTRVHSLLAAGHTFEWITAHTDGALVRTGRWRTQDRVTLRVARAVRAAYDAAPLAGPSRSTAVRSRNRGYLHPLAWDDPGTPAAPSTWSPHPPAATRSPGRPRTRDQLVEDFDFLVATGSTTAEAAARVGVSYDTVRDYRLRAAREAS